MIDLFRDWEEGVRRILATVGSGSQKQVETMSKNSSSIPSSSFLMGVLHDLNNLNTAIAAYLTLSSSRTIDDPNVARFIESAEVASKKAGHLLSMVFPRSGKHEREKQRGLKKDKEE